MTFLFASLVHAGQGGGQDIVNHDHALAWLAEHQYWIHQTADKQDHRVVHDPLGMSIRIDAWGMHYGSLPDQMEWSQDLLYRGLRRGNTHDPWEPFIACPDGRELTWKGLRQDVQYQNSEQGLRQNFIIHEAPGGMGNLEVLLGSSGDLEVEVLPDRLIFSGGQGSGSFVYEDLNVWDACGTRLRAWFRSDKSHIIIEVDDRDAIYPVTVDPISTAPDRLLIGTLAGAEFGFSVSTAGDVNGDGYSDVIISAPKGSMGETNEGLVYVYHGGPAGIPATPAVILQGDRVGASFGYNVGFAGDVNGDGFGDIIVGANTWTSDAATQNNEGAAFIFHGSPIGLVNIPAVILQTNVINTYLGYSVAGLGDINGDGYSDVIAGAWIATYGQFQEGVAFVHLGGPTGVNPVPLHRLERNQAAAQFGSAVCGAGDINGDGYNDVIVGAYRYDLLGTDDGAIFVYYGSPTGLGTGLNPAPPQTFNSAGYSSFFGWNVSTAGDVNGDGYSDIIIGDWRDNIGGQLQEGTAFIFHGSASGVITTPATIIQNDQANAWLGRSVSTAGDVNGDGYADVLIGASTFSNGQASEGATYLHLGSPDGISPTFFHRYESNITNARMGQSVSTAGDVNGDGYSDIIVGAFLQSNLGAAYVYHGGPYSIATTPSFEKGGLVTGGHYGWSVANAGDVNGDGYSDVIIGIPDASNGQAGEGMVHVHHGGPGGLMMAPNTVLEMNIAGAAFGKAVASAGDVNGDGYADVIVGAPNANGTGRAYVFHGSPSGLSATPAQTYAGTAGSLFGAAVSTGGDTNGDGHSEVLIGAPGAGTVFVHNGSPIGSGTIPFLVLNGSVAGRYGSSVATAGDVNGDGYSDIVIGAPEHNNGQVNEGVAYVHHGSRDGVAATPAQMLEVNVTNARFGHSVAGAGDVDGDGFYEVIIGAPDWASGQVGEGGAFLFRGSPSGTQATPAWTLQNNIVGAHFGTSVAEGGDVNGDGYADVVIGAPDASNGQAGEGIIYVALGRPAGTGTLTIAESNTIGSGSGYSVAGGGDVDGDGYSDVIAGAPFTPGSSTDEGSIRLYRGNNASSLGRLTRQYLADLVSPLSTNNTDGINAFLFGIGHKARSPIQRTQARLRWEVVHEGQPFSGMPITNSVASIGTSATYTSLPLTGLELKELVVKVPMYIRHKWRVRVEYPMHRSLDGQRFSRWFYGFASAHGDIGVLPVELIFFDGLAITDGNLLTWTTASENGTEAFGVERSHDGITFHPLGSLAANGNTDRLSEYKFVDRMAPSGIAYYRLRIIEQNGSHEHSPVISIHRQMGPLYVYPNPCSAELFWHGLPTGVAQLRVDDAMGRRVIISEVRPDTDRLFVAALPSGHYQLIVLSGNGTVIHRARFIKE